MGKVRTRIIGLEDVEKEQKKKQKVRSGKKVKVGAEPKTPTIDDASGQTVKPKTKTKQTKARARGKKYQRALRLRSEQAKKEFTLEEAIKLLKKIKYAKFDESVELHLNVDKEGVRGELQFPHATGKKIRVKIADEGTLKDIENGKIEFDLLVSHPSNMPRLGRFAKILGPRGLMPSPKTGTISEKPEELLKKFAGGLVKWKSEPKFPLIHQTVGKISLEDHALNENIQAFLKAVGKTQIKEAFIKTTMSPSIKLDLESFSS